MTFKNIYLRHCV